MRLSRLVGAALGAGALAGSLFMAAPASALQLVQQPAPVAAEICRSAELEGFFGGLVEGTTRGECVNILKGPSSESSTNFIAGICGGDLLQQLTGTTNKGQCMQVISQER